MVGGEQRDACDLRLRYEHSIEGILVPRGQTIDRGDVLTADGQFEEVLPTSLAVPTCWRDG